MMCKRENKEKISTFLLNYMVLEGAKEHFNQTLPKENKSITLFYSRLEDIGFPKRWNEGDNTYSSPNNQGHTVTEKCWNQLKTIRNNLFHANKAKKPDTNERLSDLLDWSNDFMNELLKSNYAIGEKSLEIKKVLKI